MRDMQLTMGRLSTKSTQNKLRGQTQISHAFKDKPQKFSDSSVSKVNWHALFPQELAVEHSKISLLEHISGQHSLYSRYSEQLKVLAGTASLGEFYKQRSQTALLKTAIKNLFKRVKFLELTIDLLNEFVSEDEYEQELSSYPNKYVIKMKDGVNRLEISTIHDIIDSLGLELSIDEVAEVFGVDIDNLKE